MAVKTGVENPADTGRVVTTRQGDQPRAGVVQIHVTGDKPRADIRRLHINEEHLRPVNTNQGNRLHPLAGRRDDMKTRLLPDQIDKRVHNFWMIADDDDAVV